MDEMYDQVLQFMETSHRAFAALVPQPKAVAFGDGYVFRYHERDIHQALVQKLARVVSGLHAARLLLAHGFLQELGALKRMLDEFNGKWGQPACFLESFHDLQRLRAARCLPALIVTALRNL